MKHSYSTLIVLLAPLLFTTQASQESQATPSSINGIRSQIHQIWLGHRSHDPSKVVINWISDQSGDSVVRYGRTQNYGQEVRVPNNSKLHHVEIPIEELDGVYHYSVQTGNQSSENATFKAYPKDELRVAVAADWQGLPDLNAIIKDDVHLLLTAGDNIKNIHDFCGPGNKTCVEPYLQLIASYPTLFRSVPFMPVLGNHDKQIRPRTDTPPQKPVYDIGASAFRRFFELPGDEWKWNFDVPDFSIRFTALDLHHISDFGSTWQSSHAFGRDSQQFRWYEEQMSENMQKFAVTLHNERNGSMRSQVQGAWHSMFTKGTIAITGFGHYAERAEVDGFSYYNTSLSGKGTQYKDSKSKFLKGVDSYILLRVTKKPARMVVEIKDLKGAILDRMIFE